jgi:transposase InsO family protein
VIETDDCGRACGLVQANSEIHSRTDQIALLQEGKIAIYDMRRTFPTQPPNRPLSRIPDRILVTYDVLFFLHLETRRVTLAGITRHQTEDWMVQMARRAVDDVDGALLPVRFVLHDRDAKFCSAFRTELQCGGVHSILLPPRSPNLNAFAERWVRSVKSECLSKFILFGEASLRRTTTEFLTHYHHERNHQAKRTSCCFLPLAPDHHVLTLPVV